MAHPHVRALRFVAVLVASFGSLGSTAQSALSQESKPTVPVSAYGKWESLGPTGSPRSGDGR